MNGIRGARRRTRILLGSMTAGLLLLSTGCTAAGPTATAGPTGSAPASAGADSAGTDSAIAKRFDVGAGRMMYLQCRGTGSPTVIFIGGLRAAADYWDRAEQPQPTVYRQVAGFSRVCSYDRPGTVRSDNQFSRSDRISQPTSEKSAVADLHALLAAAGQRGPYVLAAHSYGGFVARLYAGSYPRQVTGMVLIDALSEGFEAALTPEQYAAWKETMVVPAADVAEYPGIERLDLDAVMTQMRAAPPIRPVPLTVLSADRLYGPAWAAMIDSGTLPPGTPPDLGAVIDQAQKASQNFQARLVPHAAHIIETHSGHDIPIDNPGIVIDAIRTVVTQAR